MGSMLRSWWPSALFLAVGIVFAFTVQNFALLSAFALLAIVFSPLIFPSSLTHAAARERSATDGRPIVYWRPGCQYCLRLRMRLGASADKVHWVNIWKDPEAAAAVRAVAAGNETVPTVVAGGESMVNPDPAWVLARIR
jgi:mycoredoxin